MNSLLFYYLAFFSFFWVLGIDQLIFLPILFVGILHIINAKHVHKTGVLTFYFLFLIVSLISIFQITETFRYLTFIRNFLVYLTGFIIIYYYGSILSVRDNKFDIIDSTFFAIFIFSCQLSFFGFLGSMSIDLQFQSLAGYILPDLGSEYIKNWFNKGIIQSEALWFEQGFFRSKGLMLYPNFLGGLIIVTYPMKIFYFMKSLKFNKFFSLIIFTFLITDIFTIVNTLSRSAWGAALGAVLILFFLLDLNKNIRTGLIFTVVIIAIIGLSTNLIEIINLRFYDRTHSNYTRFLNYALIFESVFSDPFIFLFGKGTQTDHPLLSIPLGSHSTFFGILYKFGILGLSAFLLLTLRIIMKIKLIAQSYAGESKYSAKFIIISFGIIFIFLQMIFVEVDVDFTYTLIWSILVSLLICFEKRIAKKEGLSL
tara:strand:+ start:15686 stop:16963 length:1278 start_codon:yes stop_codon:yes gene_type:complete